MNGLQNKSIQAENDKALIALIIDAIQDVKGKDIVKFDLRNIDDASTDFFIICHATSRTQIAGIVSNIRRRAAEELEVYANHVEGKDAFSWMLIDFFSIIVHVFSEEKRHFYNIEDLWSDAQITKYENI